MFEWIGSSWRPERWERRWATHLRPFLILYSLILSISTGAIAQVNTKVDVVAQLPHSGGVMSVAFSPDGMRVASGGDETLKLWDASTGRLIRTIEGHSGWVKSVAFSPDALKLVLGNFRSVQLWDAVDGSLIRTFEGHRSVVVSVSFSPDGTRVLSGGYDGEIKLWDVATGSLIREFKGHSSYISSVVLSRDGSKILSGSYDKTLKLWDAATGRLIRTFTSHSTQVNSVALSPDGTRVLSGNGGGAGYGKKGDTLELWDASTGALIRSMEGQLSIVNSVVFSPDGRQFLCGGYDGTLRLLSVADGSLIRTFAADPDSKEYADIIMSVAFSPDGSRIISGDFGDRIRLWDPSNGSLLRTFPGKTSSVEALAVSPNGAYFVSAGDDKTLKIWNASTGVFLKSWVAHSAPVSSVAFAPDGSSIVSGGWDKEIKLWDSTTGTLIRTFQGHTSRMESVAFSPDSKRVLSGGGDSRGISGDEKGPTLRLWDVATGAPVHNFGGYSTPVTAVGFSHDGRFALSASSGRFASRVGALNLWDAATGNLMRNFGPPECNTTAFSPDDSRVLCGGPIDATLWDVATGTKILTFGIDQISFDTSVAFSPDGSSVLTGHGTALQIWDAVSGALKRSFKGHLGVISAVTFSPDGLRALSGARDTTTRIWNTANGRELVRMIASPDGEWLSMTPDGFFLASDDGLDLVSVVQGLKSYAVTQFRDQLFREDLVRELLSGDVRGKYRDAVSKRNLEATLKSGSAPTIEFVSQSEWAGDTIQLTVRLSNNEGGGIGKELEWRVTNKDGKNKLQGTSTPPELQNLADPDGPIEVTHGLKLDPDQNSLVTVTAKNGQGRLATEPYKIEIKKRLGVVTPDDSVKPQPRMFILAIGVNGYTEPQLAKLNYPLMDVTALAEALKSVAESSGYKEAKIIKRLEPDAIREKIRGAFEEIAAFPYQRVDTLVVLLAGHGRSVDGKYYYLPFDTHFGGGRDVFTDGISTDSWKEWVAGIKVNKKLLVVDTCESSDAIAIGRGDKDDAAHTTALDRLRVSLGESIVTAARQVAYEGSFLGHGVLTYSVLEALGTPRPDASMIDLNSLKAYLEEAVPRWSQKLSGLPQDPSIKISDNFPIGYPLAQLKPPTPKTETPLPGEYFLGRDVQVRSVAQAGSLVTETLRGNTKVQVLEFQGDWTKIARQGVMRGWVPHDAVKQLQ